jgi:hypothetical protein
VERTDLRSCRMASFVSSVEFSGLSTYPFDVLHSKFCIFLVFPMRAACSAHLLILYVIAPTIYDENCKL